MLLVHREYRERRNISSGEWKHSRNRERQESFIEEVTYKPNLER